MCNPLQKMMTDLLALSPEEYPGRKNIRVVSPFENGFFYDTARRKLEYFIDDDVMHLGSCSFFKNDEIKIVTVHEDSSDRDPDDYVIAIYIPAVQVEEVLEEDGSVSPNPISRDIVLYPEQEDIRIVCATRHFPSDKVSVEKATTFVKGLLKDLDWRKYMETCTPEQLQTPKTFLSYIP